MYSHKFNVEALEHVMYSKLVNPITDTEEQVTLIKNIFYFDRKDFLHKEILSLENIWRKFVMDKMFRHPTKNNP